MNQHQIEERLEWELAQYSRRVLDHYRWIQMKPSRQIDWQALLLDMVRILRDAGLIPGEERDDDQ